MGRAEPADLGSKQQVHESFMSLVPGAVYSGILGQREIFHKRDKYSTKERGRNGDEGEIFKVREKFSEGEILKVNKIF